MNSEREVVGACITSPEKLAQIRDWLLPEHFADEWCSRLYAHALSLRPDQIDPVTVAETAEGKGFVAADVIDASAQWMAMGSVIAHAELVLEAAKRRALDSIGRKLGPMAEAQGVEQAVAWAQVRLNSVSASTGRSGAMTAKQAMKSWFADYRKRIAAGQGLIGLPTPWDEINEATGGLEPTDLIILAARPGSGKSVAAENLSTFLAMMQRPPLVFSLEMSAAQWMQRSIAQLGSVPHDFLRRPCADWCHEAEEWQQRIASVAERVTQADMEIDDEPGLTVEQICARAERHHMRKPCSIVVVDHMHRIRRAGKNEVVELGEIARALKNLAKRLQVPVFAAAQLNRGNTQRTEKRPTMADLRGSGEIEQEADVILLAHREDYYKQKGEARDHKLEIIIGKHRHAESGKTVLLRENFRFMRADNWTGDYPEPELPKPKPKGFAGYRK